MENWDFNSTWKPHLQPDQQKSYSGKSLPQTPFDNGSRPEPKDDTRRMKSVERVPPLAWVSMSTSVGVRDLQTQDKEENQSEPE